MLAGDKFMPGMNLRQPGFIYSACGLFAKNKERIQKFKETLGSQLFIKTSEIKLAFSMILVIEILKMYVKEQFLIKYYM